MLSIKDSIKSFIVKYQQVKQSKTDNLYLTRKVGLIYYVNKIERSVSHRSPHGFPFFITVQYVP